MKKRRGRSGKSKRKRQLRSPVEKKEKNRVQAKKNKRKAVERLPKRKSDGSPEERCKKGCLWKKKKRREKKTLSPGKKSKEHAIGAPCWDFTEKTRTPCGRKRERFEKKKGEETTERRFPRDG